jgi:hypothetical protein
MGDSGVTPPHPGDLTPRSPKYRSGARFKTVIDTEIDLVVWIDYM